MSGGSLLIPENPNFNSVGVQDSTTAFFLKLFASSGTNFSEDRNLTLLMDDANRQLTISGDASLDQGVTSSSSPSFNNITLSNGGSLRTGLTAGNTLLLQARDTDGNFYETFATLTAGTTPTFDLGAGTTIGGKALLSGTYTPTRTNVTNITSSTVQDAQYIRFGPIVAVSGRCTIDPTSASVATELGLTLPFASTTGLFTMISGVCNSSNGVSISAGVEADISNNRAAIRYINTTETASKNFHYVYIYIIA